MPVLRVSLPLHVRCEEPTKRLSRNRRRVQSAILHLEENLDLLQTLALGFRHEEVTHQRDEACRCAK